MWGCLEQGHSLSQADGHAEELGHLGEAVNDNLKIFFFMRHEGAVIYEESFKDEFLLKLATEVE